MKVKLAAQILSNDVAAILKLYAETFRDEKEYDGNLKRDAILQTALVIKQLDKLFDIRNGPASKKDVKKGTMTMYKSMYPKIVYVMNCGQNSRTKSKQRIF